LKYGPDWTTPGLAELCNVASQLDLISELLEKWDFAIDSSSAHDCASSVQEAESKESDATGRPLNDKRLQVCMFCDSDQMVEASLSGSSGGHAEWLHLAPLMQYISSKRINIQQVYNIDLVLTRPDKGRRSTIIRISDYYARSTHRVTAEGTRKQGKSGSKIMGTIAGDDKAGFHRRGHVFPETELHKSIRECSKLIANMVDSGRYGLR